MNLQNILNEIDKVDGDMVDRLQHYSRRQLFKFGKKAVAAAAPVAFAGVLNEAYAQNNVVADVLNYALTLEYLEAEFYMKGLAASGLIPGSDRAIFEQISKHETAHVNLLKGALGAAAIAKPNFDFTAKGTVKDGFTNYQTFLFLAQAFEDLGQRAYKGQAPALIPFDDVLTVALNIHSVEARHAAEIRNLRGRRPWITYADGDPQTVYAGDEARFQSVIDVTTVSPVSWEQVSEAFDEPMPKVAVLGIVAPFLA